MNDLRKLRAAAGLTAEQVADILRSKYPKIDKTCISKAERDGYGMGLSREAMRYLRANIEGVPKRKEKRVKCHCVSVRLTDEQYARLQQHLERSGKTAQDYFAEFIPKENIRP